MAQVLRDATTDPEQIEQIDVILNSGEVLVHIVNDILDLSKIEAGMMKLENGPLDLGAVLRGCIDLFRGPAEERGLTLSLDAPDSIPTMKGDAHRIRQMLHNLVSNAIKFTEEGQVNVAVSMGPITEAGWKMVDITINDTGIGICEDRIKDLFAPFCQLDSSTERRFEGTGLGLAITRKFAQMMGGAVDVRSTAGVGSDFVLRLPLPLSDAPESNRDTPGSTGHTSIIKAQAPKILVAEDNRVNRTVLKALLKGLNIDLVEVEDGRAALEALRQETFDLLIFDIQMPQMSGLEALGRFREDCARSGRTMPPSIAMSANAMTAQTHNYLSAGFDRAVPKPVRKAELLATIAELLNRPG
jgi:CheY-like chemotaxis protein